MADDAYCAYCPHCEPDDESRATIGAGVVDELAALITRTLQSLLGMPYVKVYPTTRMGIDVAAALRTNSGAVVRTLIGPLLTEAAAACDDQAAQCDEVERDYLHILGRRLREAAI